MTGSTEIKWEVFIHDDLYEYALPGGVQWCRVVTGILFVWKKFQKFTYDILSSFYAILVKYAFKNIARKGENANNKHFYFSTMFFTFSLTVLIIFYRFYWPPANAFNLDRSKIQSFDQRLGYIFFLTLSLTSPGFYVSVAQVFFKRHEQFLLFPQCFLPILITLCHFHQIKIVVCKPLSVWKCLKFVVWERVKSFVIIYEVIQTTNIL